jgi:uncharacterized protein YbaP (TraB family)
MLSKEDDMSRNLSAFKLPGIVLAAMLAVSVLLAQEQPQTDAGCEERRLSESTSLWKVETDTSVVYLMGSIHLLKEDDFPLHPKMRDVYDEAETLVFEIELDSAQTPAFQQYVLFKALYDSAKTLQTELGDSVYTLLKSGMAPLGIDIEQMKQFKPWMVAVAFLGIKLQQLGFDPNYGVDSHFHEKAKSDGKHILALETPEYQINLFDSMSASEQKSLILQTLEQAADIEQLLDEIVLHWKTGNLAGLEATINKSLADHPGIRDKLLTGRNRNWLTEIGGYLQSPGTYLVIVGVAHMSGEDGLLNLLRKAGYDVEAM